MGRGLAAVFELLACYLTPGCRLLLNLINGVPGVGEIPEDHADDCAEILDSGYNDYMRQNESGKPYIKEQGIG